MRQPDLCSPVLASLQDVQLQHVVISQQGVCCSAGSRGAGAAELNCTELGAAQTSQASRRQQRASWSSCRTSSRTPQGLTKVSCSCNRLCDHPHKSERHSCRRHPSLRCCRAALLRWRAPDCAIPAGGGHPQLLFLVRVCSMPALPRRAAALAASDMRGVAFFAGLTVSWSMNTWQEASRCAPRHISDAGGASAAQTHSADGVQGRLLFHSSPSRHLAAGELAARPQLPRCHEAGGHDRCGTHVCSSIPTCLSQLLPPMLHHKCQHTAHAAEHLTWLCGCFSY